MSRCPVFDLTAPETYLGGMPRETFKYLRNEQPVYWHEDPEQGRGFWAVTRHQDLDFISKNPLLFSSEAETCFLHEQDPEMLEMMRLQMIVAFQRKACGEIRIAPAPDPPDEARSGTPADGEAPPEAGGEHGEA